MFNFIKSIRFPASKSGTFMYHGHASSQRGDGVLGSVVVGKKNDINGHLYDKDLKEHVIVLLDWYALIKKLFLLYNIKFY